MSLSPASVVDVSGSVVTLAVISDTHGKTGRLWFQETADGTRIKPVVRYDHKGKPLPRKLVDEDSSGKMSEKVVDVDGGPEGKFETPEGESGASKSRKVVIPYADIFVHCGDFSMRGAESEIAEFIQFLRQLPHAHKIVTPGNHDAILDTEFFSSFCEQKKCSDSTTSDRGRESLNLSSRTKDSNQSVAKVAKGLTREAAKKLSLRLKKELRSVCTYLDEEMLELDVKGIDSDANYRLRVFGSPIQPHPWTRKTLGEEVGGSCGNVVEAETTTPKNGIEWAFGRNRGSEIAENWARIPRETDILITHGPPFGRHDRVELLGETKEHALFHSGCADLLTEVENRVRPLVHLFGHVHEDPGWSYNANGSTLFLNAAVLDRSYNLRTTVIEEQQEDLERRKRPWVETRLIQAGQETRNEDSSSTSSTADLVFTPLLSIPIECLQKH
ncbi:unnamed protein product [Amoebophrya sp. A25]|nr:unnamed protein product [Amoebophrya sp. A25]|eukprot:GSA25T00022711001.1